MSKPGKSVLLVILVASLVTAGLIFSSKSNDRETRPPGSAPAAAPGIKWHHSLTEAQAEAKARKTLIVVDAYADWCGWCKKMDADTFANAEVQQRMRDFTLLKIDTDKEPEIARRYGISGLPTTLVLDAAGKVILNRAGYLPPKDFLQLLAQAGERRAD